MANDYVILTIAGTTSVPKSVFPKQIAAVLNICFIRLHQRRYVCRVVAGPLVPISLRYLTKHVSDTVTVLQNPCMSALNCAFME